jgi:hypothetical protein
MGNLLSFPLLCLVNFLAFKFVIKRTVPLRINGDDIVFRARRSEAEKWMEMVGRSGLTLSKGKTLVSDRFFSLNSRFFEGGRTVRLVPVIRSKALFGSSDEGVLSLRDRFRSCQEGMPRNQKEIIRRVFLRVNRKYIIASRRSVRSGLGLRVTDDMLRDADLFFRELCYVRTRMIPGRGLVATEYIPEVALSDALKTENPYGLEGWTLERLPLNKVTKVWQREHGREVIAQSWIEPFRWSGEPDKYFREEIRRIIRDTGVDFADWLRGMKRRVALTSRMMRISKNSVWDWVRLKGGLPHVPDPPKVKLLYRRVEEAAPLRQLQFIRSSAE